MSVLRRPGYELLGQYLLMLELQKMECSYACTFEWSGLSGVHWTSKVPVRRAYLCLTKVSTTVGQLEVELGTNMRGRLASLMVYSLCSTRDVSLGIRHLPNGYEDAKMHQLHQGVQVSVFQGFPNPLRLFGLYSCVLLTERLST